MPSPHSDAEREWIICTHSNQITCIDMEETDNKTCSNDDQIACNDVEETDNKKCSNDNKKSCSNTHKNTIKKICFFVVF